MTVSSLHNTINRLQTQIADLRRKDAQEARKEAQATAKANKASIEAAKSKTTSAMQSKIRQLEAAQKEASGSASKRASTAKEIANKTAELLKSQAALAKEEERQRTKIGKDMQKQQTDLIRRQREIENRATKLIAPTPIKPVLDSHDVFDVFISHASEDKEEFVEELAQKAEAAGLAVFYDRKTLQWGDSLRQRIEHGLANSSFGVVVLSEAFFKKEWPKRELDGLFNLEIEGRSRILPIWHKISKDEVVKHAPSLSGKLALTTASLTVDEIVEKLVEIVRR